jgi:hypothetical protein
MNHNVVQEASGMLCVANANNVLMNATNFAMIDVFNYTIPSSMAGTTFYFFCAAALGTPGAHCLPGSVNLTTPNAYKSEMRGAIAINALATSTALSTTSTTTTTTATTTKAKANATTFSAAGITLIVAAFAMVY